MIILRSQRPSFITAGKLYIMHLENFTAVRFYYMFKKKKYIKFLLAY